MTHMGSVIWCILVLNCLASGWVFLRRRFRQFSEEMHVDLAREHFRMQREWLEARFLGAIEKADSIERIRWEDAQWHSEILWARDRKSRVFLALVRVHFNGQAYNEVGGSQFRHATAIFEFRKGRWHAEGQRLDEMRPDEAVLRGKRFEPVVMHQRRMY